MEERESAKTEQKKSGLKSPDQYCSCLLALPYQCHIALMVLFLAINKRGINYINIYIFWLLNTVESTIPSSAVN